MPDPEPVGVPNPWRTYLACLRAGANLGSPFVIMQDDCVPVEGFLEAAGGAREARPDALISFCLQGMAHQNARSAFWRAQEEGKHLILMHPHNWIPAMALGWTQGLAERCLLWDETSGIRASATADDGRLFTFARKCNVEVWVTVPCLVDHPDDTPSLTGATASGRPSRRPIAMFTGDASTIIWD